MSWNEIFNNVAVNIALHDNFFNKKEEKIHKPI